MLQVFGLLGHLHAGIFSPVATDCLCGTCCASLSLLGWDTHPRVPRVSGAEGKVTPSREGSKKALWKGVSVQVYTNAAIHNSTWNEEKVGRKHVKCSMLHSLDQVQRQAGAGHNSVKYCSTKAGSSPKNRRVAALHKPARDLQAILHHHYAQRHSTVQWDLNPEVSLLHAPYVMRRATVSLTFDFRAYVVKIFNEVFGGGGRRDKSEIGPSVNGTIDKLVTLSTDGGRTAGEAYMAAIIIGMVRLISSLLLAQLLTRWVEAPMHAISSLVLPSDTCTQSKGFVFCHTFSWQFCRLLGRYCSCATAQAWEILK